MFSLIRKRLIDILGIGNILYIDHSGIQNVRSYKTCRNVKLNKFFLLCIWPNSSIEKGLFLKCHNVIDLVNSSPNMDRFCHCGRNLEFCREIWICTNCQNWYFTLFIIILRFVWKWFRNGSEYIFEFWAVSRSDIVWIWLTNHGVEASFQDKGSPLSPS